MLTGRSQPPNYIAIENSLAPTQYLSLLYTIQTKDMCIDCGLNVKLGYHPGYLHKACDKNVIRYGIPLSHALNPQEVSLEMGLKKMMLSSLDHAIIHDRMKKRT